MGYLAKVRGDRRRKTNGWHKKRCLFTFSSTCFGHHYAHHQEKDWIEPRLVLAWMCWLR